MKHLDYFNEWSLGDLLIWIVIQLVESFFHGAARWGDSHLGGWLRQRASRKWTSDLCNIAAKSSVKVADLPTVKFRWVAMVKSFVMFAGESLLSSPTTLRTLEKGRYCVFMWLWLQHVFRKVKGSCSCFQLQCPQCALLLLKCTLLTLWW